MVFGRIFTQPRVFARSFEVWNCVYTNSCYYSEIQSFLNNGFKSWTLAKNKNLAWKPHCESIVQKHLHITLMTFSFAFLCSILFSFLLFYFYYFLYFKCCVCQFTSAQTTSSLTIPWLLSIRSFTLDPPFSSCTTSKKDGQPLPESNLFDELQ